MMRIHLPDALPPDWTVRDEPTKGSARTHSDPTANRAVRNADRAPQVTWQLAVRRVQEKRDQGDFSTLNGEITAERLDRLQERFRSRRR